MSATEKMRQALGIARVYYFIRDAIDRNQTPVLTRPQLKVLLDFYDMVLLGDFERKEPLNEREARFVAESVKLRAANKELQERLVSLNAQLDEQKKATEHWFSRSNAHASWATKMLGDVERLEKRIKDLESQPSASEKIERLEADLNYQTELAAQNWQFARDRRVENENLRRKIRDVLDGVRS